MSLRITFAELGEVDVREIRELLDGDEEDSSCES
jgi:hypothetical protein